MSGNDWHVDAPTPRPFLHEIFMTPANMGYLYAMQCKMQYNISLWILPQIGCGMSSSDQDMVHNSQTFLIAYQKPSGLRHHGWSFSGVFLQTYIYIYG